MVADPLIAENVRAGLQAPKDIRNVITVALSLAALTGETDYQQIEMIGDELLAELTRRKVDQPNGSLATGDGVRVGPYLVDRDTFARELRRAARIDPGAFAREIDLAARKAGGVDRLFGP